MTLSELTSLVEVESKIRRSILTEIRANINWIEEAKVHEHDGECVYTGIIRKIDPKISQAVIIACRQKYVDYLVKALKNTSLDDLFVKSGAENTID